jgi:L-methionine (R)-S-oxide reductase
MAIASKTDEVRKELEHLAGSVRSAGALMETITRVLHDRMLKYNWVGFYMLEKSAEEKAGVLALGAFQGAMTPHTRIPLNQGICGAAASTGRTLVIDDVGDDSRYLACSTETKSEIVVPIFVRNEVVGELDIDSHFPAAFSHEDRELVEYCAGLVGKLLEQSST